MRIENIRVRNIRCFDDTGHINLGPSCNLFVGLNNAGKSTLLKAITAFQGMPFTAHDIRSGSGVAHFEITVNKVESEKIVRHRPNPANPMWTLNIRRVLRGNFGAPSGITTITVPDDIGVFSQTRPNNALVISLAKRKAANFEQTINTSNVLQVTGTHQFLYSRIDEVSNYGHPSHEDFKSAVKEIVGLKIATRTSPGGKEAGFYLSNENFVTLDRMGDGIIEMMSLIVDLCIERNKIFVLEEPELNLHPKGLKALLALIRAKSGENQFIIATHSNIVVRELASENKTKIFRVAPRVDADPTASTVNEVQRTPSAHIELLEELGYEFSDFGLHAGWLFLEESSAESVISQILIPMFAPGLQGRLRTYAASGVSKVAASVDEFRRLMTFIHLEPVYEGRFWVRVDGDAQGLDVVSSMRKKFPSLDEEACSCFEKQAFEHYYPHRFSDRVASTLTTKDMESRRREKQKLLVDVLEWTKKNPAEARVEWEASASEPIRFLKTIESRIN
jgi:predicted ATPase